MKQWIGKKIMPHPISTPEAAASIESAFLSRFFPGTLKRDEARAWIQTHFPAWPEEARRAADQILSQLAGAKESRSGGLLWKRWWRPRLSHPTLSNGNGHAQPVHPPAFHFEFPGQRLLPLARGYWYTGHDPYRHLLFAQANAIFSSRHSWRSSQIARLSLWKGVWLLRFTAEIAAPEEVTRLWQALLSYAARESKKKETPDRGLFLFMMGALCTESSEGRTWSSRGSAMLEKELLRRVGRDGVCRSKLLSDQIDLLWIYLQAILIGRRHAPFPDHVEQRIEKMLALLSLQPQIPLLEPGRSQPLFSLNAVESRSLEKILGIGAIIFNRSEWKRLAGGFSEEAFFLTGPAGYQFYQEEEKTVPSPAGSLLFEEGGYALLRSRPSTENALLVRAVSYESHPMTLSMVSPARLFVNDPSIHIRRSGAKGPLRPALSMNGTPSPWSGTFLGEEFDYVEGEQFIDRSSSKCKQKRSVLFIKPDYWIIHDLFSGDGKVNIDWQLPFMPQARIEGNLADGFHITTPDGRLWLMTLGTHLDGVDVQVQPSEKQVVVRSEGALPISLTTVLYPDRSSSPARHDFKSLYFPSVEGGSAFEIFTETHTDLFLFAPGGRRLSLSNVCFEGERLFVRKDYLGEIARVFALSGRACLWEGKRLFESQQPIPSLELSYRGEVLHVRGALSGRVSFYADGVEEVRVNGEKTYFTRDRDQLILHF